LSGSRPCLVVRLAPANKRQLNRQEMVQVIRSKLMDEIHEAVIRLRDLSGPGEFPPRGYPLHLALHGPDQQKVHEWAEKLTERLHQSKKLADVWANRES